MGKLADRGGAMSAWLATARVFALIGVMLLLTSGCGQFFRGPQDLTGLSIAPNGNTIKVGTTQQFTATGTFQYYNGPTGDVTAKTTWESSDPTIVTIDASGLATGVTYGTVTIKGACESYHEKVTLTVGSENINLTSITISPADKSIIVGNNQQFTATAEYSNNT